MKNRNNLICAIALPIVAIVLVTIASISQYPPKVVKSVEHISGNNFNTITYTDGTKAVQFISY
jgi:hypothetical protein